MFHTALKDNLIVVLQAAAVPLITEFLLRLYSKAKVRPHVRWQLL